MTLVLGWVPWNLYIFQLRPYLLWLFMSVCEACADLLNLTCICQTRQKLQDFPEVQAERRLVFIQLAVS